MTDAAPKPAANPRHKWYIVNAYSNFEKKVAEQLREQAKQQGLEDAFYNMVAVLPRQLPDVQGEVCLPGKGGQKFLYQFCVKRTHLCSRDRQITDQQTPARQIHRG